MEQTDLILLVLIILSVFAGLMRGFCDEILRLAIYVLSGVLGYALAPAIQPLFSSVPEETLQKGVAIFAGTIVAWFGLKIAASFLTQTIKESSFRKLDQSLGGIFGALRAGIVLITLCFVLGILNPHMVQTSRILTISDKGALCLFASIPEIKNFYPKKTETTDDQELNWKKRLLNYLQNTTIGEKEEEITLLSYISSKAAKEMSQKMFEQGLVKLEENKDVVLSVENEQKTDSKEQTMAVPPEILEESAKQMLERQIMAWLKDEPLDQDEMQKIMADKLKERMLQNEDSGD